VGTAEPRKGLDVLVGAMGYPPLRDRRLVVVGPTGWGNVSIATLAGDAGVSDRVLVTGRVPDADLAAVYAGASVLAMPSRAEGFGLPVLEAMTQGVPVVTSADPALVEVGGGAALITAIDDSEALADALGRAAESGPERDALVQRGVARADQFDWGRTARRMWGAYADVAREG